MDSSIHSIHWATILKACCHSTARLKHGLHRRCLEFRPVGYHTPYWLKGWHIDPGNFVPERPIIQLPATGITFNLMDRRVEYLDKWEWSGNEVRQVGEGASGDSEAVDDQIRCQRGSHMTHVWSPSCSLKPNWNASSVCVTLSSGAMASPKVGRVKLWCYSQSMRIFCVFWLGI